MSEIFAEVLESVVPSSKISNNRPMPTPTLRMQRFYFAFLSLFVFFLHFSDGHLSDRKFINYDDLDLVEPMVKLSVSDYFTKWLPDRNNHAYPLRDMTLLLDHAVTGVVGFPVYWISQTLLFILLVYFCWQLLRFIWPKDPWLTMALITLIAVHPVVVEVVQWMTIRKHLMAILFLVPGTTYVLKTIDEKLTAKQWGGIISAYLASLLCFPTGLLWMPWVLFIRRRKFKNSGNLALAVIANLIFISLFWIVTTSGENDYAHGLTRLFSGWKAMTKGGVFFVLSAGRGSFNFVLPFWVATFYKESHPFTWVGLALLIAIVGGAFVWRKTLAARQPRAFRLAQQLGGLALITLAPSAIVFLGFAGFVWADRYDFTVLPFALPALALLGDIVLRPLCRNNPRVVPALLTAMGVWIGGAIYTTIDYVPAWRDALSVMKYCVRNEESPKCVIQTLQRALHVEGCGPMARYLDIGRKVFESDPPKYNPEFMSEMPFYDALCIALNAGLTPPQKIEQLPFLFDTYKGAGEIMFSIILSNIEGNRIDEAFKNAKRYFLSDASRPIVTTYNTVNIYRGHIDALCEIIEKSLGPTDCRERQKRFEQVNARVPKDKGYRNWGYGITEVMWQRRIEERAQQ